MKPYPWQLDAWQSFEQRMTLTQMPHAMLFSGPRGIGKLNFARTFVYRLFCHAVKHGLACGECDACHLLNSNNHPDLYNVAKPEDKKNISVDQIRELIAYANLTPHSAPKKIAIVEQAEFMNIAASNSLLKTLEEPPASSVIILLTHRPDQLLATIRSRCQSIPFALPERDIALAWLHTKVSVAETAEKLLALANGAPLTAMEYESSNMLVQRDEMFTALKALHAGQQNPISIAKLWLKMDFDLTLYCMSSWITDMVRLKVSPHTPALANPDIKAELALMGQQSALAQLLDFYEFVNKIFSWQQANINTQLILEEMLLKWSQVMSGKYRNGLQI